MQEDKQTKLLDERQVKEAFQMVFKEKKEEKNFFELEELFILLKLDNISSQKMIKEIFLEIVKNQENYLKGETAKKEMAFYQSKLTEEQKKLTGKKKFEEAWQIIKTEQEQIERKKIHKKMEKTLKQFQRRIHNPIYPFINNWPKKIGMIIASILLIPVLISSSPGQTILSNNGFFSEQYEEYTSLQLPITFRTTKNNNTIKTYYEPSYLPKGYELETTQKTDKQYVLLYHCKTKDSILNYSQIFSTVLININNIKGYDREIINGKQFYYYKTKHTATLLYYNENYQFTITDQNANFTKKELIQILDSIIPVNLD